MLPSVTNTSLALSSLSGIVNVLSITKATPIHFIDEKFHINCKAIELV